MHVLMTRLSALFRWRRWRAGNDSGSAAVIIAVVLGGGVLLGSAALSVDVGRLYAEHEELQSGAEAAAMAVALNCASPTATSCGTTLPTATQYANNNAKDGASAVNVVCGSGGGLPGCPAQPSGVLSKCSGTVQSGQSYVEVRTSTLTSSGSTLLPPAFSRAIAGYEGSTVHACARAAWGTPGSATSLAITFSLCEWNALTGSGVTYPTAEFAISLHGRSGDSVGGCDSKNDGQSGLNLPGGFGWLDSTGSCTASTTVNQTVGGSTGTTMTAECETVLKADISAHTPVLIAVYDTPSGTGSHAYYHVVGYASMMLTGYFWSSSNKLASWLSNKNLCSGSDRCLYGFFTKALVPADATIGTGTNYGATVVNLIG